MHKDRIKKGKKITYKASIKELPDGGMFSNNGLAYLIFNNKIFLWSFEGYRYSDRVNTPDEVDILTPKSIINTFKLGFKPEIHKSIESIVS